MGLSFARFLAAEGCDLVLVARSRQRLEATANRIADEFGVDVRTIVADLTTDDGCAEVGAAVTDVDVLVNNAGMGLGEGFTGASLDREEKLLDLNVRAVLRLTRTALPAMMERGQGSIVNVSSVAGFGPIMPGSTYNASKAWVTNFSESIAPLARRKNVRVMAFCPGFVRTEFHASANIPTSDIPSWMWLDSDAVVETAMRDLRRGKVVSVPSLHYKVITALIRHTPHSILSRIAERASAISARGHIH